MNILKSNFVKILISGLILLSLGSVTKAENLFFFTTNLYWNTPLGSEDVKELQIFLTNQGLYTGPITGNFMTLTFNAVKAFQTRENIVPASGYFGPTTRRVANSIISSESKKANLTSNQVVALSLFGRVWTFPSIPSSPPPAPVPNPSPLPPLSPIPTPVPTPTPPPPTPPVTSPTPVPTPTPIPPPPPPAPTPLPPSPPIPTPPPPTPPTPTPTPPPIGATMEWGAYVGDSNVDINTFENLVGKEVDIRSIFYSFDDSFPMFYSSTLGAEGKTMLLFWESSFGYDTINNGSRDAYIRKFAQDAKAYGYPIMLSPFHEMNGNWSPWGGTINNNTPTKFITAWKRIHSIFKDVGATNVKFALVYNSTSVPNINGNQFDDYYPGGDYVDLVGVDGFNFGVPWMSFKSIFDAPLKKLTQYNKPIYIFSMGSVPGAEKAAWIQDSLGVQIHNYPVKGWVWFNQNGHDGNWLVNSDPASLEAFKKVIPN